MAVVGFVAVQPVHGEAAADGRRPDRGLAHEPRLHPQYLYDYALVNEAGIEALGLEHLTAPPVPGIVVERDANGQAAGRLLGGIGPFNTLVASILSGELRGAQGRP